MTKEEGDELYLEFLKKMGIKDVWNGASSTLILDDLDAQPFPDELKAKIRRIVHTDLVPKLRFNAVEVFKTEFSLEDVQALMPLMDSPLLVKFVRRFAALVKQSIESDAEIIKATVFGELAQEVSKLMD